MTILLTGAAGFIGAAVAEALLARGERVVGLDNLNAYYDPALKRGQMLGVWRQPQPALLYSQRLVLPLICNCAGVCTAVQTQGGAPAGTNPEAASPCTPATIAPFWTNTRAWCTGWRCRS